MCYTRSGALHLNLPAPTEAYAAVGMGVGEQCFADAVDLCVQLVWNVGCLEHHKCNKHLKKSKNHMPGKKRGCVKGSVDLKGTSRMYLNYGIHQRVQQRKDAFTRVPSFSLEGVYGT